MKGGCYDAVPFNFRSKYSEDRPHIFRHSAATYYAMDWSVARLKHWFGWKQSDQAETYVHENDDKMRQARLAEEGIEPDESDDD